MAQFLRIPRRRSDALRHARRVLVVGHLDGRPRLAELLRAYFGEGLRTAATLPPTVPTDVDALLLCNAAAAPMTDLDAVRQCARGRQMVMHLPVLAAAMPEKTLTHHHGDVIGSAIVKHAGWFMAGFGSDDVLPWWGGGWIAPGPEFTWRSEQAGLHTVLQSFDRRIYVMQLDAPGGRAAALDLDALEKQPDNGFRDLVGLILLEALGAQQIDMGQYVFPFHNHDDHLAEIEAWCGLHEPLVRVSRLQPPSVMGRQLRRIDIGDTAGKPTVLLTCVTHGHEWGPSYGVFAFLRHLLHDHARGGAWGRIVLENLGLVWIPVVSVDGFERTFRSGEIVPYGPNWVDLNRNFGPHEYWSREAARPRGKAPFSEPEAQAVKAVVDDLMPRLKLHVDFHEQTWPGTLIHCPPTLFLEGMAHTLRSVFDGRYLHESLSSYARDTRLQWQNHHGPVPSEKGEVGVCSIYARAVGGCEGGTGETFGNDDLTPFHTVGRVDATAAMTEALVGAVLGRTAYNHRCTDHPVAMTFPEREGGTPLQLLRIDADGRIMDRRTTLPAAGVDQPVGPGQRLLALAASFRGDS